MSRLEDALARFSVALDRLEVKLDERGARDREVATSEAELKLLKGEREQLVARVAALEEESRNLAGLTEEVDERLDGAIAEIREMLGRN